MEWRRIFAIAECGGEWPRTPCATVSAAWTAWTACPKKLQVVVKLARGSGLPLLFILWLSLAHCSGPPLGVRAKSWFRWLSMSCKQRAEPAKLRASRAVRLSKVHVFLKRRQSRGGLLCRNICSWNLPPDAVSADFSWFQWAATRDKIWLAGYANWHDSKGEPKKMPDDRHKTGRMTGRGTGGGTKLQLDLRDGRFSGCIDHPQRLPSFLCIHSCVKSVMTPISHHAWFFTQKDLTWNGNVQISCFFFMLFILRSSHVSFNRGM